MLNFDTSTLGTFLKEKRRDYQPEMISYDYGTVESCADGIVRVAGLGRAEYGELLQFENDVYGIALDLGLNSVGAALLTRNESVRPGSPVQGTGRVADIGVGRELLGRIVDPIGRPLDGQPLHTRESRAVESPAPAIMDRAPVDTPMETGILAVDSMIPIGRGQRELIIGDRQTGKTSIALSAMVNQKDTGVICVYCAIGQKAASVANLVHHPVRRAAPWSTAWWWRPPLPTAPPCSIWPPTPPAPWRNTSCTRARTPWWSTTISPSTPRPTVPCPCCCAGPRAVRPTPATCSICTPVCWSGRPG